MFDADVRLLWRILRIHPYSRVRHLSIKDFEMQDGYAYLATHIYIFQTGAYGTFANIRI
jgi:hypothetical protein